MKPEGKEPSHFQGVILGLFISALLLTIIQGRLRNEWGPGFLTLRVTVNSPAEAQAAPEAAASIQAFLEASKVFLNPRCVNCHPKGDAPLQGDQSRTHAMRVRRGPEGLGVSGLWCSTCHQAANLPGEHLPPGAPGWQLPTQDMPMVFENRTPRELCLQFKDPAQNGGRTPEEVLDHVQTAPLVLWGWDPGEGRAPVPVPHPVFVKHMTDWVKKGAVCPQ
ncbi:MAG: hypothetical protein HY892_07510 [Deltaproteobacteria bacterium]|nr:hypothetical protein [Deltaproteobacteria bacterium]